MRIQAFRPASGDDIFDPPTAGVSDAAREMDQSIEDAWEHSQKPLTSQRGTVQEAFRRLSAEWKNATEYQSSAAVIAMHPAYQRIIGMGREALPFILRDLEETHAAWFWALSAITGEDPVPAEDRGYVDRMTRDWILWGMRQRLI